MSERIIFITEFDLKRLRELIADAGSTDYRNSPYLKQLDEELHRGQVVRPQEVPADVVTMNSRVLLIDVESGEEMEYTLVFPQDADPAQGRLSVLAPIGTAMLGYRVGDVFSWQVPDGVRKFKVAKILFQPEPRAISTCSSTERSQPALFSCNAVGENPYGNKTNGSCMRQSLGL